MGRHIYVPKPPKKRGNSVSKSKTIARAVLHHLHTSKDSIPAASSQISSMGPRDSTERNGSAHSSGRGKSKAKLTRSSSTTSLRDLTQEDVDGGINAVRHISKILCFMQAYQEEIDDVERVYGLGIRQQARIDELETMVTDLTLRKDREVARLLDENHLYKADIHQLELDREKLDMEKASMNDTRAAIKSDLQRQKEEEIGEAKRQLSENATARVKRTKEELEKKIKTLQMEHNGLRDAIKILEDKNVQAQKNFNEQEESFQIEKRSSQLYIRSIESELRMVKALSTVSPQKPQFYINGFYELFKRIQDVALNDFISLPEDPKSLDSDAVRDQLCQASGIFEYPLLSSESTVSTFLRAYAIQDFISTTTASIIQRRYFAEPTTAEHPSGVQSMDFILNAIAEIPPNNPSQELSWQLTTIEKLDRLDSHASSGITGISTQPDEVNIVQAILDKLRYFQSPSEHRIRDKLTAIANLAITIWSALRRDSCRVHLDYEPSTDDRQQWDYVQYQAANSPDATSSPSKNLLARLPSKPFVLFPRITGFFDSDVTRHQILYPGVALSHESAVFREGLEEIEHINHMTKEFERGLRKRAGTQSSPIMENRQGELPVPHSGCD